MKQPKISAIKVDRDTGLISFYVEGVQCWELQFAYMLSGPWYHIADGTGSEPVIITPEEGSPRYYRVAWRDCEAQQ